MALESLEGQKTLEVSDYSTAHITDEKKSQYSRLNRVSCQKNSCLPRISEYNI